MTTTRTVDVMDLRTGDRIGTAEISAPDWAAYEGGTHPDYQWPGGTARAADVLTGAEMERDGIEPGTVIFLD